MRRDAFQAIADPTRREILGIVSRRSLNINALTENFGVSRTAIYKHIKILTECGLVVIIQQGRERYCEARMEKLHEVSRWVAQYSKHWHAQLDSLELYINRLQAARKTKISRKKDATPHKKVLSRKGNGSGKN